MFHEQPLSAEPLLTCSKKHEDLSSHTIQYERVVESRAYGRVVVRTIARIDPKTCVVTNLRTQVVSSQAKIY